MSVRRPHDSSDHAASQQRVLPDSPGAGLFGLPERSVVALLMVLVVVQWAVYMGFAYAPEVKAWCMPQPDTMNTLLFARTWVHGHPLQVHPGDPPSTMHSDFLSPLLYSAGWWLGLRSPSSFVLSALVMCLIVALAATRALWVFFRRFMPTAAVPAAFACALAPGIFGNVFHTNFGFFFAFFWGALASLHSFPRFMALALLAGLCRPEGLSTYVVLVSFFGFAHGWSRMWRFLPGCCVLAVPPLLSLHLTGSLMPMGVVPQNISHYEGINSLTTACAGVTDQIKGTLLGLFSAQTKIGARGSGWLGTLPPLVGLVGIIGLARRRPGWLLVVIGYMALLIAGDSITVFSGIHFNRHLQVVMPFFLGGAFDLLATETIGGRRAAGATVFVLVVMVAHGLGAVEVARKGFTYVACDKQIADHILTRFPGETVLSQESPARYWFDGNAPWYSLSVSNDPVLSRQLGRFGKYLETAEYVQRTYPRRVVLATFGTEGPLEEWLSQFSIGQEETFEVRYRHYGTVRPLDLSPLADRPPFEEPFDELDVGDASSERVKGYRHWPKPGPASMLPRQGEEFWDGGRRVRREEFTLTLPSEGGSIVARYYRDPEAPAPLEESNPLVRVIVDGIQAFSGRLALEDGFSHHSIPVSAKGTVKVVVEGDLTSCHYWVYEGEA
ncbi:hypothetical protein JXA88_17550 [Candidatus Fermentibacteria bacterium]|nr:hypothetical protein [Candidatus Fermentibacteria bacterium]